MTKTKREEIDLTGLKCPMPIIKINSTIKEMAVGDELVAIADDPVFCPDIKSWCKKTGHELVEYKEDAQTLRAVIRKRVD